MEAGRREAVPVECAVGGGVREDWGQPADPVAKRLTPASAASVEEEQALVQVDDNSPTRVVTVPVPQMHDTMRVANVTRCVVAGRCMRRRHQAVGHESNCCSERSGAYCRAIAGARRCASRAAIPKPMRHQNQIPPWGPSRNTSKDAFTMKASQKASTQRLTRAHHSCRSRRARKYAAARDHANVPCNKTQSTSPGTPARRHFAECLTGTDHRRQQGREWHQPGIALMTDRGLPLK